MPIFVAMQQKPLPSFIVHLLLGSCVFLFFTIESCTVASQPLVSNSVTSNHPIHSTQGVNLPVFATDLDSPLFFEILPRIDSLQQRMSQVLTISSYDLIKGSALKLLDSFFVSRLSEVSRTSFPTLPKPDMVLFNTGGLRQSIFAGPVTKGHVYELMPFDNVPVWLWMRGEHLRLCIDNLQKKEGQPLILFDKPCHNPLFLHSDSFSTIDHSRLYLVLTSDFVASGGDKLIRSEWIHKMELTGTRTLRDLLIDSFKEGQGR